MNECTLCVLGLFFDYSSALKLKAGVFQRHILLFAMSAPPFLYLVFRSGPSQNCVMRRVYKDVSTSKLSK